jgi:acetyl esterase
MKWFWDMYLPDPDKRKEIYASPLNATIDQLTGLPSALIIIGKNDVLHDEGEAYANKLMQAGVDVTAVCYAGTIHDYLILDAIKNTPAVKSTKMLIISHLNDVFKK